MAAAALLGKVRVSGPFTYAVALPPVTEVAAVPVTVTVFAPEAVRTPDVSVSVAQLIALSRVRPDTLFTVNVPNCVAAGNSISVE